MPEFGNEQPMEETPSFPDLGALTEGLRTALAASGTADGPVTVLDRQPSVQISTFPSEVVSCRLAEGREVRLLCKYEAGYQYDSGGARGRVPYEAEVYRDVVRPLPVTAPRFYGSYRDPATGDTWLFIQFLEAAARVHRVDDPEEALVRAARWIGRFHALNEARLREEGLPGVYRYGADYYCRWARQTSRFAGPWHQRLPWLAGLCARFEELVPALLDLPPTIIHGEYYPKNILTVDGTIYPVDWESAAVAFGELDLATLTEGWGEEAERLCVRAYRAARWPHGAPAGGDRALQAARLFVPLRWLGEPGWAEQDCAPGYFEQMHAAGRSLGLI